MRVAIIGANGQLGVDLVRRFRDGGGHDVLALTRHDADARDRVGLAAALAPFRPEVVVNTAAFHKVDICEDEPWTATETNVLGTANAAFACRDLDALLVHLSTDYVFSGTAERPYREEDPAEPVNVYGATKLAGERLAAAIWPRTLIVRTSGLFGHAGASGKGGNFVETMLRLGRERGVVRVVTDQVLGPTYTPDLAEVIAQATERGTTGTLHVTNSGHTSWFGFTEAIFDLAGVDARVEPTTTAEFGARARRPAYSVLAHDGLAAAGLSEPQPWREALAAYIQGRRSPGDI